MKRRADRFRRRPISPGIRDPLVEERRQSMKETLDIRRVTVEFLRPGPSHNQLLSPYTQYLAVCNDAGAAVVTVPYEHRVFERRVKELRYEIGDQRDRLEMLHEIGRDMGKLLGSVPGFTGALSQESGRPGMLVHLRITLSAAELALLPFELAEVPVGSAACAVSIQTRPPVSITRHIRTVPSDGLSWPARPRILFISSDSDNVPFAAHRTVLCDAIAPFIYPNRDEARIGAGGKREQFGELLTILADPTLAQVQGECEANAYTHVHILTHGDLDVVSQELYGLIFRDEDGTPDVVSGERFVTAVTRTSHRPSVVTIASCDSGNVGSVIVPGASFAHALHQSGIPFVVGAQFPLSKEGSIPLTRRLYNGFLWGEHPLDVLRQARAELHTRYNTNWHDWASVVAYEALPPSLDDQLDVLQYSQAKLAAAAALEQIDIAVASDEISFASLEKLNQDLTRALDRMPSEGQFAVECIGLHASSRKRLAQAAFKFATRAQNAGATPFGQSYDLLDRARLGYARAAKGLLVNDARAVQRNATLHWVLVQYVALSAVLRQPLAPGEWEAACVASDRYLDHRETEQRAWAHASLAELWLIRLASPDLSEAQQETCVARAVGHAEALSRFYPGVDEFPVLSTRRQFERYVDWWGQERFAADLEERGTFGSDAWKLGRPVIDLAVRLKEVLKRRTPPSAPPKPPSTDPEPPSNAASGSGGRGSAATPAAPPSASPASRSSSPSAAAGGSHRRTSPFFTVEALPAGHGDCLWIEYGASARTHRWLIDCGTPGTSRALLARLEAVPSNERFLELFILSHIDSDHIGGALGVFRAARNGLRFGDVWFNGWRHVSGQLGARQGEMFSTAILELELPWNVWQDGRTVMVDGTDLPVQVLPGGMTLTLLSPTRATLDKLRPIWTNELKRYGLEPGSRVEYGRMLRGTPSTKADAAALADIDGLADTTFGGDNGAPNGTSIAVLAEYEGAGALFAADAHAPVLVNSIQKLLAQRKVSRLKLDLFKVSHHGSQNNVSSELVQLLDCERYLISTNGDHFYHPDRQAIARILKYGGNKKTLYFNYNNALNEVWGDALLAPQRAKYGYSTIYPAAATPGLVVSVL
jgi:beta-lactamase superfamily II metal-dependent hydrolase